MSPSASELELTRSISHLTAAKSETVTQFLEELASKVLKLPGVKAFEIKPTTALSALADGPFLWTLGPSRIKPAGTVSAPIEEGNWGELQIRFDLAHFAVESPVRFARFAAQQIALVAMANELSKGLVGTIVQVTPTAIQFTDHGSEISVSAGQVALDVNKHLTHDPTCGAMQWFHPFATVDGAEMGVASRHLFTGSALGTKWSDPNKRSAFFGTFSY